MSESNVVAATGAVVRALPNGGPSYRMVDEIPAGARFATTLRSRPGTLVVGDGALDAGRWTLRVEIPEAWDVVRVSAEPAARVRDVKDAAIATLMPDARHPEDFVVKLRGAVVLDERLSLANAGALDGSILLVTHRRRRPVR